jgi:hypothetical protein
MRTPGVVLKQRGGGLPQPGAGTGLWNGRRRPLNGSEELVADEVAVRVPRGAHPGQPRQLGLWRLE